MMRRFIWSVTPVTNPKNAYFGKHIFRQIPYIPELHQGRRYAPPQEPAGPDDVPFTLMEVRRREYAAYLAATQVEVGEEEILALKMERAMRLAMESETNVDDVSNEEMKLKPGRTYVARNVPAVLSTGPPNSSGSRTFRVSIGPIPVLKIKRIKNSNFYKVHLDTG